MTIVPSVNSATGDVHTKSLKQALLDEGRDVNPVLESSEFALAVRLLCSSSIKGAFSIVSVITGSGRCSDR